MCYKSARATTDLYFLCCFHMHATPTELVVRSTHNTLGAVPKLHNTKMAIFWPLPPYITCLYKPTPTPKLYNSNFNPFVSVKSGPNNLAMKHNESMQNYCWYSGIVRISLSYAVNKVQTKDMASAKSTTLWELTQSVSYRYIEHESLVIAVRYITHD